jgi:hypothetical protein
MLKKIIGFEVESRPKNFDLAFIGTRIQPIQNLVLIDKN